MTIAFVLGNGVSREHVPLPVLKTLGKIYGCNALYRDFIPDVLVATDRPISQHIQETGYAHKNIFFTRRPLPDTGAQQVPSEYYGYSSGPIATSLAARDLNRRIYMIGFDMGPTLNNGFNNLYADTEFYKTSTSLPTFTGNWIKQIGRIAQDFPTTKFFRVCGKTTSRISELDNIQNLQHIDMSVFLDRINTQKDL